MIDAARLPAPVRRGLGQVQHSLLAALGAVEDRSQTIYGLDAALSRRRLHRQLAAYERRDRTDPTRLRWSERSWRSQNGEDGVIDAILERIGAGNRFFVEVGASDGEENCTRHLLDTGWSGVWVEADEGRARRAASVGGSRVVVVDRPVFRTDVVQVLTDAGVPEEPDVLVVDIDSDDLGVLDAALGAFRPRLVVTEYNAVFSPAAIWATPVRPDMGWDGTFRHGASLAALDRSASAAGYQVVHCDRTGVNAFFVRGDLADGRFHDPGDVLAHHRRPSFTCHAFGHPRSRRAVSASPPLTPDDVLQVTLENLRVAPAAFVGEPVDLDVTVCNGSPRDLTSGAPYAVNLCVRWIVDGDEAIPPAAPRTSLARRVRAGSRSRVRLWIPAPAEPGPARLRVTMVAEGVFWREHLGGPGAYAERTVEVAAR